MIPPSITPRSKYGNRRTEVDGVVFASAKEARRASELRLLARAGQISDLRFQPEFPLVVNGELVCKYLADASYRENGLLIVEDTKSPITRRNPVFRIKVKLLHALEGITVREV